MNEIDSKLQQLDADASAEMRLQIIWDAYTAETGKPLNAEPSQAQRKEVHDWLKSLRVSSGDAPHLLVKRPKLQAAASISVREKASQLSQHWCTACELYVESDNTFPLYVNFPIQVTPWSAQSVGTQNKLIKDAVRAELKKRKLLTVWDRSPLCMSVVTLVPHKPSHTKDVDNLVKGLLDSLTEVLYSDDRRIQCLTSRRVEYAGSVGMYLVSARAVHPWDVDVVFDSPADPIIVSGEPIVI